MPPPEPTRRRERERPFDINAAPPRGRGGSTLRLVAAAVVIVIVLIVIATQLFGGGSGATPPNPGSTSSSNSSLGSAAPARSSVTVAVLNGTHTGHLASGAMATLTKLGYRKGAVADAPSQGHSTTFVGYTTGNRAAAVEVAADIGVSAVHVHPVDGLSLTDARAGGAAPQVVLTLGSNYVQR